jgi:hypothetical protein
VSAAYLIRGNRWGRRSAPATAAAAGRDVGPRSHAATQQGEVREREHATLPAQVHAQRRLLHPPPTAQCTACLLSHLLLPPQLLPLPPLPPSPVPQGGCTAAAAVAVQYAPLYKPGLRCVARSSPGGGLGRCCSPCIATRPPDSLCACVLQTGSSRLDGISSLSKNDAAPGKPNSLERT